jgi:hypothetical protein
MGVMAKDKDQPSKADRKAAKQPPRSSKQRQEDEDAGKNKGRSFASLQQESYRRGQRGR